MYRDEKPVLVDCHRPVLALLELLVTNFEVTVCKGVNVFRLAKTSG